MAKAKLTETEQKVLRILRQGVGGIDDIKSAMEMQEGHPFHRWVIVMVVSRLYKMRIGVRKIDKGLRRRYVRYVAAA